ncbi:MAG: TolC family protein, partial [Nannocystaceae bacterium]
MMALLPPWALATALLTLTQPPASEPAEPEGPAPTTDSLSDEPEPEVAEFANPLTEAFQPVAGGLTANAVASKATEASLDVAIAEADIAKAAAQLDQTMINFIPSVSVSAGYTRLSYAETSFGGDDDMADGGFIVGAATEGPIVVGPCPGGMGQCVLDSAGIPVGAAPFDTSAFSFELPLNSFSLEAKLSVPISDYILSLMPARRGSIATRKAAEYAHQASTVKAQT